MLLLQTYMLHGFPFRNWADHESELMSYESQEVFSVDVDIKNSNIYVDIDYFQFCLMTPA